MAHSNGAMQARGCESMRCSKGFQLSCSHRACHNMQTHPSNHLPVLISIARIRTAKHNGARPALPIFETTIKVHAYKGEVCVSIRAQPETSARSSPKIRFGIRVTVELAINVSVEIEVVARWREAVFAASGIPMRQDVDNTFLVAIGLIK